MFSVFISFANVGSIILYITNIFYSISDTGFCSSFTFFCNLSSREANPCSWIFLVTIVVQSEGSCSKRHSVDLYFGYSYWKELETAVLTLFLLR